MNIQVTMGDLIFTRWGGLSAKITLAVTRGKAAHQEQICQDGAECFSITADSVMNRMSVWEWSGRKAYFAKTGTEWCRFTPADPLDFIERATLHAYFEEAKNTFKYSIGELLLQGIDAGRNWIMGINRLDEKAVKFRKWGDAIKSRVICSTVACEGLVRIGMLPAWSVYWSPADTLHYVSSTNTWIMAEATPGFFGKPDVDPAGGYGGG
jgi:hypothetical protein